MPAKSKSQQRFFGMVHACQKKGKCASPEVRKVAKEIDPEDADDFASTKHDGLPETKDESYNFSSWLRRRLMREGAKPIITPRLEVNRDGIQERGYWLQSPENPPVPIDVAQARRLVTNQQLRWTDRSHMTSR